MTKLQTVLDALPALSAKDLDAVLAHIRALRGFAKKAPPPEIPAAPHDWLLDGIQQALLKHSLKVNFSPAALASMNAHKTFTEVAPAIAEWFEKLAPNMTRTEKVALGTIAAEALISYMGTFKTKVPLGVQTMLSMYKHTPLAFERAFPGYADQGWVPFLLQRDKG